MTTRTLSLIVTGLALIVIAVLCGLGISNVMNKQDPDGPATTPSGHFTTYTPTPDTTASPSDATVRPSPTRTNELPGDPPGTPVATARGGGN